MKLKTYNIKPFSLALIIVIWVVSFCIPGFTPQTEAALIPPASIGLEADHVVSESELKVRIAVSTKTPVNAFDIELVYPRESLEFLRSSTKDSAAMVWKYLPKDQQDNVIRLTGGMIDPFVGEDGEIITLIFFVKKAGTLDFVFNKIDFAIADGKGTVVSVLETSSTIVITDKGPEDQPKEEIEPTPTPPPLRIKPVEVTPHPSEDVAVVTVETEDDGAIKETLVREREWFSWSDWRKMSGLTVAVPKYAWNLQFAVIGWDGTREETMVYRWDIIGLLLSIIILLVLIILLILYLTTKVLRSKDAFLDEEIRKHRHRVRRELFKRKKHLLDELNLLETRARLSDEELEYKANILRDLDDLERSEEDKLED